MLQDTCPADHKDDNVHLRCLHEACVTLGGEHQLAAYLGVAFAEVEAWLKGLGRPPDWVFLRCYDLLLESRS
jgi:hypothetical protein